MKRLSLFISLFYATGNGMSVENFPVVKDLYSFVRYAMDRDPRIQENRLMIDKAHLQKATLRNTALLPKLELSGAVGPAPAYTVTEDQSGESDYSYDFGKIDPFIGFEFKVQQPLNFRRLHYGLRAASYRIDISKNEVKMKEVELCRFFQEIYFKYLYALEMHLLMLNAKVDLEKAIKRVKSLLEKDDPTITQTDLLALKSYTFKIDDGLYRAESGLESAKNAIIFSLGIEDVMIKDSLLYLRTEKIFGLDTLIFLLQQNHPDIKRLTLALKARLALVAVARNELFPDAFIIGNYRFTKSWKDEQHTRQGIENLLDPYNKTDGSLGIGIRLKMNMWSTKDKYHKEKLELKLLQKKELYALKGLMRDMENQYRKIQAYRKRQASSATSLRSAESLLKGMIMKYDLDPSQIGGVLTAKENNIQAHVDYYKSTLEYNIAVAELIAKTGLTMVEYYDRIATRSFYHKIEGVNHE